MSPGGREGYLMPDLDLVKTGIKGLDDILFGGIPRGNIILVAGTAGAGGETPRGGVGGRGAPPVQKAGGGGPFGEGPRKRNRGAGRFGGGFGAGGRGRGR